MHYTINKEVEVPLEDVTLTGNLVVPEHATGIVLFSHGSGSSRFSPRNNFVAQQLQRRGIATLLFDLLTKYEDAVYENRFNIDLLTERLLTVTQWVKRQPQLKDLPLGFFGASTGAASALKAAAKLKKELLAVVSRGGRPDLAIPLLDQVQAATLLIVGGLDTQVIELNRQALKQLECVKDMKIIDGATHLFEEPGTLEKVAGLACDWFEKFLNESVHADQDIRHTSEH